MAKPGAHPKEGIEYHGYFHKDDVMREVLEQYGEKGHYIYCQLKTLIFDDKGYYAQWGDKALHRFAYHCYSFSPRLVNHRDKQLINEVVELLVELGYFDKNLYSTKLILTGYWVQMFYFDVTKRRVGRKLDESIILPEVTLWLLQQNVMDGNSQIIESQNNDGLIMSTEKAINVDINSNSRQQDVNSMSTEKAINVDINSNFGYNDVTIPSREVKGSEAKRNESEAEKFSGFQPVSINMESDLSKNSKFVGDKKHANVSASIDHTVSVDKDNEGGGGTAKKLKSNPDPARPEIIRIWKEYISQGLDYTSANQTREDNMGLKIIINNLRAVVKTKLPSDISEETDLTPYILAEWEHVAKNWNLLDDKYFRNAIQFKDIGKNIINILGIIKSKQTNGKATKGKPKDYTKGIAAH